MQPLAEVWVSGRFLRYRRAGAVELLGRWWIKQMMRLRLAISAVIGLMGVMPLAAVGDSPEGEGGLPQPAATPVSPLEADPAEGVIIFDAHNASARMARAQEMERQKDWAGAAAGYQEILDAYGSCAFPTRFDDDGHAVQYANLGETIQSSIAHWPIQGIYQYRDRYESSAIGLLAAAGPDDMAGLDRVCAHYFCTLSGKQAAMRMLDGYMEAGEFAAAARIGNRLLLQYPDLGADRPAVLYRTALALAYGGDAEKAAALGAELKRQFPTSKGVVRGNVVLLADSLARELAARPAQWQPADSWPTVGGDWSRDRVSVCDARAAQLAYSIAVDGATFRDAPDSSEMSIPRFDRISTGRTIGILPSVDRGQLFFQDGHHVFAVDLATGAPLPGWLKTWPKGVYTLPGVTETSRGHQLSISLTDSRVLAIMAHPDQQAQDEINSNADASTLGVYTGEPRLVCLDRATGAESWTVVLSKLPDSARAARRMQMIGSPLVVGGQVLVTARGRNTLGDAELAYVLAFDLNTGAFRWCTFIAAHSPVLVPASDLRSIPAEQAEVATHLAYADGLVYVQSNLGVLAALDAWGGAVDWLDVFPIGRTPPKVRRPDPYWAVSVVRTPFDHKPWTFNPVEITQGLLFTMPAEGQLLHVCDPLTGTEIKRINLAKLRWAAPDPGSQEYMIQARSSSFDTLVGIRGDAIILASERWLYCLDWKHYDPAATDPIAGPITRWHTLMPTALRGRACMTDREILVPCQDGLYRLDPATGKITGADPPSPAGKPGDIAWKPPGEPGNVLAIGDHVIIAGANTVSVYRDHR